MIRALAALSILALSALAVRAEPLPALYSVVGVQADDVLNIRRAPDAKSEKVGALGPQAKDVEVVTRDASGRWGNINTGERSGWVAMRYLERQPGDVLYPVGRDLWCSGTEPFWSMRIAQGEGARFDVLGGTSTEYTAGRLQPSAGRSDRFLIRLGDGGQSAVIRRGQCSDGMSDRVYGIGIDLIRPDAETGLWSGCCTLRPPGPAN